MATFTAAYVVVLLAVVAFLARMETRQRRLRRTVETLKERLAHAPAGPVAHTGQRSPGEAPVSRTAA